VTANVSGATVMVDGRNMGDTPLSYVGVSAGSHRVQVKKSGYETYRTRVEVAAGRSASLEAYLTKQGPKTCRLYVNTDPSDARVRILNIGPRFSQGMDLDPGDYHVEASATGHGKQTRWVSLSGGEDKRIDFRLSALAVSKPIIKSVPPPAPKKETGFSNSLGMAFVYIEPGTFTMGSPTNELDRSRDERQHRVTLTWGYYMQTTEVTQGQWKAVMGGNPSQFKNCGDDCPVEQVSWDDVQEFIRRLNQKDGTDKYRLPTEAQWEYACRAGSTSRFGFGDRESRIGNHAWYESNSRGKTHAAGQKQAHPWGLHDMHGNVWEWCQDRYGDYPTGSVTDPKGALKGGYRVYRGGSWSNDARNCRSASRDINSPGYRSSYLGFRLARTH